MQFEAFPKIGRMRREVVITEKIDGTNAQVAIEELNTEGAFEYAKDDRFALVISGLAAGDSPLAIRAGSRNRWLTPDDDNFGFARWVAANAEELRKLGPGRHFGEWWGAGIQRRYGIDEKRFSLFSVHRWTVPDFTTSEGEHLRCVEVPVCHVVPVLDTAVMPNYNWQMERLRSVGSVAAPGFRDPEGIVIYHTALRTYGKMTLNGDEAKGS